MKLVKYYAAYVPIIGIFVIVWYGFWSHNLKDYCLYDETNSLIVGLIQFFTCLILMMNFNLI